MLDFRAHTRLATVGGLDRLINVLAPAVALVGEVLRPWRAGADRRPLSSVRLIAPDSPLLPMQQVLQRVAVGHIGCRGEHRVNQLRTAVDSDVRLHAEVPLLAFRGLMHLRVALAVFVLRRTRRANDGRVDNRPGCDLDAATSQVLVHAHQQLLPQSVLLQQMAKLAHRRLVRRRLDSQINAREVAHRGRLVQGFLDGCVRQVEPQLRKVHPQHPLQRQRRSSARFADLRIKWFDHRNQFCPRHDHLHIREELRTPRRLRISFKSRQCLLLHHPVRELVVDAVSDSIGKSEFP
jgi:hypothetical protein